MIWQGFTRAHTPTIEGLRHGGAAEHTRHALTAFGSGWRGISSAPAWLLEHLGRKGAANSLSMTSIAKAGAAVGEVVKTGQLAGKSLAQSEVDVYRKLERELAQMERWSDRTGTAGMLVNRDYMAAGGAPARAELRAALAERKGWHSRALPKKARQVERGSWFQTSKWEGFDETVAPLTAEETDKIRMIFGLSKDAPVQTHPKAARKAIDRWEASQNYRGSQFRKSSGASPRSSTSSSTSSHKERGSAFGENGEEDFDTWFKQWKDKHNPSDEEAWKAKWAKYDRAKEDFEETRRGHEEYWSNFWRKWEEDQAQFWKKWEEDNRAYAARAAARRKEVLITEAASWGAVGLITVFSSYHKKKLRRKSREARNWKKRQDRQTQIEGLTHGGKAAEKRHEHTDFGSGWRGLVAVPREVWNMITIDPGFGQEIGMVAGMASDAGQIDALKALTQAHLEGTIEPYVDRILRGFRMDPAAYDSGRRQLLDRFASRRPLSAKRAARFRDVVNDLDAAAQWHTRTGMLPVMANTEGLAWWQMSRRGFREILRHERIHGAHWAHLRDPFVRKSIEGSTFEEAVAQAVKRITPWFLRPFVNSEIAAKHTVKMYEGIAAQANNERAGAMGELIRDQTEHLAWANQGNTEFFEQAAEHGWADPRHSAFQDLRFTRETAPNLKCLPVKKIAIGAGVAAAAGVTLLLMRHSRHKHERSTHQSVSTGGSNRTSQAI